VNVLVKNGGWIAPVALVVILAAFWLLNPGICSIKNDSPTFDEGMFITQGIYILHRDDYSLAIQHPPLSKILMAVPTLGMELNIPRPGDIADKYYETDRVDPILKTYVNQYKPNQLGQLARNPYYIGYHLLYDHNRWDIEDIFERCRRVIQLLHYLLVFVLYLLVRKIFNPDAAIVAACIAFFDPNMVAHGHLCTTDIPVTLFSVLSFLVLVYLIDNEKPHPAMLILWGISIGLMCATKFSCLILLPVHAGIFLWAFRKRIGPAFLGLVVASIAAIIICFILGGFSFTPYVKAGHQLVEALHKGRPSYLLGQYSTKGFPLYYLATLLFKMPVGLLLMTLAGIVLAFFRSRNGRRSIVEIALWLMPGIFLLSTMIFHSNNLGIRHILLIYPFLIAIGASIMPRIPKIAGMTGLGLLLGALIIAESVPAMSDPIPFFNTPSRKAGLAGKLLADSNIDWGQDLSRLADFCSRNNVRRLNLRYFGSADVFYHLGDIPGFTLDIMGPEHNDSPGPPGWYAVSLQKLLVVRGRAKNGVDERPALWWLFEMEPYARVGGSIFVYRVDE